MKILHFADAHINAADHGNWSLRDATAVRRSVDKTKSKSLQRKDE